METPVIDWQHEYLDLNEKYQQIYLDAIRLESKLQFWMQENAELRARLLTYEGTTPGTCALCGRDFQQQHDGRKRKYCGNACKTKASREKKLIAELETRMRQRSERALSLLNKS